jgi:AraC-like DNA-binding protein
MQPVFEKVITPPGSSILVENIKLPYFVSQWHFHPEIEMILINKGTGTLFIGNSMHRFEPGTLALIGENVPHVWMNDKEYYAGTSGLIAHSQVIKFKKDFWGREFASLPEMKPINDILSKASRGILFEDGLKLELRLLLKEIFQVEGMERILKVLDFLTLASQSKSYSYLSIPFDGVPLTQADCQKIDRIYRYLMENFSRELKLADISKVACMNPSALCRYIKTHTLKTLSDILNEIRVGFACKLLTETEQSISQISENSGYNYLSNFYKQFEKLKSTTPGNYRESFGNK